MPEQRIHLISVDQATIYTAFRGWRLYLPAVFLFCYVFAMGTAADWPSISLKTLFGHDDSVNSTVSANLTRRIFPAMVRVNPLVEQQGTWMEGPNWQHIPPMFAYVPLPLFALDGRVTIEMKRFSYSLVLLLTGVCFIIAVSRFDESWLASASAGLAAMLWFHMPFTRRVIFGWYFGASDVVLACAVVLCLWLILRYLQQPSHERAASAMAKLALYAAAMALPVVVKSALGLIPAATFFALLLWDQRQLNRKVAASALAFVAVILACYLPLYLSSPETFRREIFLPLDHMGKVENWALPWHYFITHYLREAFFRRYTPVVYLDFILSAALYLSGAFQGRARTVLALCGGWFVWNLVTISAITSKSPNFIFQSTLPMLFFAIYAPARWLASRLSLPPQTILWMPRLWKGLTLVTAVLAVYGVAHLARTAHTLRNAPYTYRTPAEHIYHLAEMEQAKGANTSDLYILNIATQDCFSRYPFLFLTGGEARTLGEMLFYNVPSSVVAAKYRTVHLVLPATDDPPAIAPSATTEHIDQFQIVSFSARTLTDNYVARLNAWVAQAPAQRSYAQDGLCPWHPFDEMHSHS